MANLDRMPWHNESRRGFNAVPQKNGIVEVKSHQVVDALNRVIGDGEITQFVGDGDCDGLGSAGGLVYLSIIYLSKNKKRATRSSLHIPNHGKLIRRLGSLPDWIQGMESVTAKQRIVIADASCRKRVGLLDSHPVYATIDNHVGRSDPVGSWNYRLLGMSAVSTAVGQLMLRSHGNRDWTNEARHIAGYLSCGIMIDCGYVFDGFQAIQSGQFTNLQFLDKEILAKLARFADVEIVKRFLRSPFFTSYGDALSFANTHQQRVRSDILVADVGDLESFDLEIAGAVADGLMQKNDSVNLVIVRHRENGNVLPRVSIRTRGGCRYNIGSLLNILCSDYGSRSGAGGGLAHANSWFDIEQLSSVVYKFALRGMA